MLRGVANLIGGGSAITGTTIAATTAFNMPFSTTGPTIFNTAQTNTGYGIVNGTNLALWLAGTNELNISSASNRAASGGTFGFSSSATNAALADSAISRISAGVIGIGTGAAASFAGRIKLTSTITAAVTVATLNASPTIGEIQVVSDASAVTAKGATVAAGGAAVAVLVWNGANWVGI